MVKILPFTSDDFTSPVTLNGTATLSSARGNTVVPFTIVLNPIAGEETIFLDILTGVAVFGFIVFFVAVCALEFGLLFDFEETQLIINETKHFIKTGNTDYVPKVKTSPEV
jgi:hypothetical protein